jgi:predicted nucleic acid-binding protein
VIYLDAGCLLKLYYPEPNSAAVAAAVTGEAIVFTALHELETMTALQLKRFRGEATVEQAEAARRLVDEDVASGKLTRLPVNWPVAMQGAAELARAHAATKGCRSLDVLHCAVAQTMAVDRFVSSDARQLAVAAAAALPVMVI